MTLLLGVKMISPNPDKLYRTDNLLISDQGSPRSGHQGAGDCQRTVRQEVLADHGPRLQLCHLSGGSPQGQGADLHAQRGNPGG